MLPFGGVHEGRLLSAEPYSVHGLPHLRLRFRYEEGGAENEGQASVAADQVEGAPVAGDEVRITFFFGQVLRVEKR